MKVIKYPASFQDINVILFQSLYKYCTVSDPEENSYDTCNIGTKLRVDILYTDQTEKYKSEEARFR